MDRFGHPTLAISPQDCTRNDLRRSNFLVGGSMPSGHKVGLIAVPSTYINKVHTGTSLFKFLDLPLDQLCAMARLFCNSRP